MNNLSFSFSNDKKKQKKNRKRHYHHHYPDQDVQNGNRNEYKRCRTYMDGHLVHAVRDCQDIHVSSMVLKDYLI